MTRIPSTLSHCTRCGGLTLLMPFERRVLPQPVCALCWTAEDLLAVARERYEVARDYVRGFPPQAQKYDLYGRPTHRYAELLCEERFLAKVLEALAGGGGGEDAPAPAPVPEPASRLREQSVPVDEDRSAIPLDLHTGHGLTGQGYAIHHSLLYDGLACDTLPYDIPEGQTELWANDPGLVQGCGDCLSRALEDLGHGAGYGDALPGDEYPIHYAPYYQGLPCDVPGDWNAIWTNDLDLVRGCGDCLVRVFEGLGDRACHMGRCLECRRVITAKNAMGWRQVVRLPCPALAVAWSPGEPRLRPVQGSLGAPDLLLSRPTAVHGTEPGGCRSPALGSAPRRQSPKSLRKPRDGLWRVFNLPQLAKPPENGPRRECGHDGDRAKVAAEPAPAGRRRCTQELHVGPGSEFESVWEKGMRSRLEESIMLRIPSRGQGS